MINNKKRSIAGFTQQLFLLLAVVLIFPNIILAGNDNSFISYNRAHCFTNDIGNYDNARSPTIMVTFTWSFGNIGDIGITPGIIHLIRKYVPNAKIILVANSYSEEMANYYSSRFPDVSIIPSPFKNLKEHISYEVFKSLQETPRADPFYGIYNEKISKKFQEAFESADLILYNSGTTLSYGRWDYDMNRTMSLAWPLFLAQKAGKPYGIYCQSFERFAWPSNELFVPMLSGAKFVFCRDGNSLEYLKASGVRSPILEFGPDATFSFQIFDEQGAKALMDRYKLETNKFITITIRTGRNGQGFLEPGGERELSHASKLRELIKKYVDLTGNKVLICPEVESEIGPAKELILDLLPDKTKKQVAFLDKFWSPDIAYTVYSKAEAVVSMEMHSVIMALSVGTPVLHPRFIEAGRKAWMLKDLGISEWLFDIDDDSPEAMLSELMKIHNNFNKTKAKVESVMKIVHKRQDETMKIVKKTLDESYGK